MKKKLNVSSQRQIVFIMLSVVVPLIVIIATYNIYTVDRTNSRVFESSKNTLSLYQNALDSDLHSVENLMVGLAANDVSFRQLKYQLNSYDVYSDAYNVMGKYQDFMSAYPIIGAMCLETQPNNLFRTVYNGNYTYQQKQQMSDAVYALIKTGKNYGTKGWFYEKIGSCQYLLRILGQGDLYTVCIIDPNKLEVPQNVASSGQQGVLLYATQGREAVTMPGRVKEEGIALQNDTDSYYVTGTKQNYLAANSYSEYAKTMLVYLEPYRGYFQNLDMVQMILLLMSVLLVLFFPVALYTLNRSYFRPMNRLMDTMERIKSGDFNAKMEENYRISEFQQFSTTFNEMVDEIKNLKIESYEKELERQQAQLFLLQSQTKPHFYLNCLKSIYALAQEKKFETIQQMVIELSGYLRFMLKDNSTMVQLSEELRSVHNYIALQQMGSSNPPECQVTVEEGLERLMIPPISILAFVENAVKYASSPERQLMIKIKAVLLRSDAESYVNFSISDNGGGFPDEMLVLLNKEEAVYQEGHTGIANVKQRFNLIYHGKSTFSFFNQNEGSCIEIFIPYTDREE